MLPDMLEDAMTIGLRSEELEPLFRGAEDFVQTWERGCKKSPQFRRPTDPPFPFGCN